MNAVPSPLSGAPNLPRVSATYPAITSTRWWHRGAGAAGACPARTTRGVASPPASEATAKGTPLNPSRRVSPALRRACRADRERRLEGADAVGCLWYRKVARLRDDTDTYRIRGGGRGRFARGVRRMADRWGTGPGHGRRMRRHGGAAEDARETGARQGAGSVALPW